MKNADGGQLYTIEGFAAALIMVITAFLVVNATSVYTAGDTHITDMQLEALGTDALMTMGTPVNGTQDAMNNNRLRNILESGNSDILFGEGFMPLVNANETGPRRDIQYNASYSCRYNNQIRTIPFSQVLPGRCRQTVRWRGLTVHGRDVCT